MADRFDKFTERARRVLTYAHEEARRFNHNYIGTEHILLGLTRLKEGVANHVLANLGVDLNTVRSSVEFIIGRGERAVVDEIGLTPRAKKVIELAVDEARRMKHHYIGTEHLLLGLVREGEGVAAGVLESFGVSLKRVRAEMMRVLSHPRPPERQPPGTAQRPTVFLAPAMRRHINQFDDQFSYGLMLGLACTGDTREAVERAGYEAARRDQRRIEEAHLLLGLLRDGGTLAADLKARGVDLDALRAAAESLTGPVTAAEGDEPSASAE
jgi:ATP-dependent Clp protease ATP-binding subunit ClpA